MLRFEKYRSVRSLHVFSGTELVLDWDLEQCACTPGNALPARLSPAVPQRRPSSPSRPTAEPDRRTPGPACGPVQTDMLRNPLGSVGICEARSGQRLKKLDKMDMTSRDLLGRLALLADPFGGGLRELVRLAARLSPAGSISTRPLLRPTHPPSQPIQEEYMTTNLMNKPSRPSVGVFRHLMTPRQTLIGVLPRQGSNPRTRTPAATSDDTDTQTPLAPPRARSVPLLREKWRSETEDLRPASAPRGGVGL
ncbi:hypothetical protein VTJ04DRAFT_9933 [Mycothermus thermophilus]|uniref:uncharacterized protein n=1 Tax=Humicola insolens TaxID=85995 RepID=UPI003742285F